MANTVTFDQVKQAAARLTADGRTITCRELRAVLGKGSLFTINQHLHRMAQESE